MTERAAATRGDWLEVRARTGADVPLDNLNMLCVRYLDRFEREVHLPLGPLYVTRSLEDAGYLLWMARPSV